MKRDSFVFGLIMAICIPTALVTRLASAEQVPFRGRFTGVATPASVNPPFACGITEGSGNTTQLGRFVFHHPHCVNLLTFEMTGELHFTAANGDMVFADFRGQSHATPVSGVRLVQGTATITGGTGRFLGASGSFDLERLFYAATGATEGWFQGAISSPGAVK